MKNSIKLKSGRILSLVTPNGSPILSESEAKALNDPFENYHARLEETFENLTHFESTFAFTTTLRVTFQIQKTTWDNYRKTSLGQLYGVDLSNFLSRKGILNFYAVPVVDDKKNARNGIKTIHVEYRKERA